jgi:regulator of sigma E protease
LPIVIAVIALCIIILIHELGHFGAAKLFGMNAYQFNLGMGPILWKKKHKETQYALRAFPIGGSVLLGEDDDEPSADPRDFRNKPVWQRIIVIGAGAFLNIVLGLILSIILNIANPIASLTVDSFYGNPVSNTVGSPLMKGDEIVKVGGMTIVSSSEVGYKMEHSLPKESDSPTTVSLFHRLTASNEKLQRGDRIVNVNGVTVSCISEMLNNPEIPPLAEQDYHALYNLTVIRDGEPLLLENVPFAAALEFCRHVLRDEQGNALYLNDDPEQGELFCGRPVWAENRRVYCDEPACGEPILDDDGMRLLVRDFFVPSDYNMYEFVVRREGELVTLPNVSFAPRVDLRGEPVGTTYIRDFWVEEADKSFLNVMEYSFRDTVGLGRIIWLSILDIIRGTYGLNDLSGPVGIAAVVTEVTATAETIGETLLRIVSIAAFITINLGIVNLLPIPALDGARILFLIAEAIRRKPLNQNAEAIIHFVGFSLLMVLIVTVTFNDIRKLIFGG